MGQATSVSLDENLTADEKVTPSNNAAIKCKKEEKPTSVTDSEKSDEEEFFINSNNEGKVDSKDSGLKEKNENDEFETMEISQVTEEVEPIPLKPENISKGQLEQILLEKSITRKDIINTFRNHPNELDLYYKNDQDEESDLYQERLNACTNIALMILGLSSTLRDLRFKLVPAKVSEGKFWGAVFVLLGIDVSFKSSATESSNDNEQSDESSGMNNVIEEKSKNNDVSKESRQEEQLDHNKLRSSVSDMGTTDISSVEDLRSLLRKKDQEISRLRREVAEARANSKECRVIGTNTKLDPLKSHKGKWILSQDSTDFLNLDEEIKRNLRREKQKRLQEINGQMKFILDSDDIKDADGKWNCCNSPLYDGKGCI